MSCNTQRARLLIKRGSGRPTIPTSPDHTDGTWLVTDIYIGEQYMDIDTGIIYTRTLDDEIIQVGSSATDEVMFIASQAGGAAATIDEIFVNTATASSNTRKGVGEYEIVLADSYIGAIIHVTNGTGAGFVTGVFKAPSSIFIKSYDDTGTLSDDILDGASVSIKLFNSIVS